jgi:cation transport ATPase
LESQVVTDHPIAHAIFSSGLKELGSTWTDGQHLRAHRNVEPALGRGVKGDIQLPKLPWCEVVIGSARFLADCGYNLIKVPAVNTEGIIVVHMGVSKQYAGTFLITVGCHTSCETVYLSVAN